MEINEPPAPMKLKRSSEASRQVRRQTRRRWAFHLNAGLALLLAAAIGGMVHYLASRHYVRWDWSRSKAFTLSDKTLLLLDSLDREVQAIVFFQPGEDLYNDIENLLREYQYASPHLRVEHVDPDRQPLRARQLMEAYKVEENNVVVFDAGGGRSCFVPAKAIADYDYSPVKEGKAPIRKAFRGEESFSSALQRITHGDAPVVYFLGGHGECMTDDFTKGLGLSELARLIRQDNIEIKPLLLGEEKNVPADCRALVVAGPRHRLAQPELDRIAEYLRQRGRALFLLDGGTDSGLEALLRIWGVCVGDDQVVDATRTWTGRELFTSQYGAHPVTARMQNLSAVFDRPRSVQPCPERTAESLRADRPKVTPLALSSEKGWAERDYDQNPMKYDPARDLPGPVSVAVAVEKGPIPGIDVQIPPTRMVVFGDIGFVVNGSIISGNGDLFMNALNWVLDRQELMGIAPKPVETSRLDLDARQIRSLGWLVIGGLPGVVAAIGLFVWLVRRR